MGSVLVVVADIVAHESFQMPFIEHNHVVKQVAAAASHPTLCESILQRAPKRCTNRFSPQLLGRGDHVLAEFCIPIEQEKPLSAGIRPRFAHLLTDPERTGIPGHVAAENFPATVAYHEEAVQDSESERRHGEE